LKEAQHGAERSVFPLEDLPRLLRLDLDSASDRHQRYGFRFGEDRSAFGNIALQSRFPVVH
jgi:hypothetical protein